MLDDEIRDLEIFKEDNLLLIRNNLEEFSIDNNGLCKYHIQEAIDILNKKVKKRFFY